MVGSHDLAIGWVKETAVIVQRPGWRADDLRTTLSLVSRFSAGRPGNLRSGLRVITACSEITTTQPVLTANGERGNLLANSLQPKWGKAAVRSLASVAHAVMDPPSL